MQAEQLAQAVQGVQSSLSLELHRWIALPLCSLEAHAELGSTASWLQCSCKAANHQQVACLMSLPRAEKHSANL